MHNLEAISTRTLFTKAPLAVVSVINDLASDNRVRRTASTLEQAGFEVLLAGRRLRGSPDLRPFPFRTWRMRLPVNKGPAFYLLFNLRLFLKLLFCKADLYFANDLDTLAPNFLASRLRKKPLIYDSHELFCEVPELLHNPLKRRIWLWLEKTLVPKLKHCITVNESIAAIFRQRYGVSFEVVRNITDPPVIEVAASRESLGLPLDKKIVLLQGAGINIDRGAEELVESMKYLDDVLLLIIGSGDVWDKLEKLAADMPGRVRMIRRLPAEELRHYTLAADLGISIDKATSPNYYYSLPNKIFDYLSAGLPVLASELPEVKRILNAHHCGVFIQGHDPLHLAERIRYALGPAYDELRRNAAASSNAYPWKKEQEVLLSVIRQAAPAKA